MVVSHLGINFLQVYVDTQILYERSWVCMGECETASENTFLLSKLQLETSIRRHV